MNLKIDLQNIFDPQISRPGKGSKEIPEGNDFWLILFALLINPDLQNSMKLLSENITEAQIQSRDIGLTVKVNKFEQWPLQGEPNSLKGFLFSNPMEVSKGEEASQDPKLSPLKAIKSKLEALLKTLESKGEEVPALKNFLHSLEKGESLTSKTLVPVFDELRALIKKDNDPKIALVLQDLLSLLKTKDIFATSEETSPTVLTGQKIISGDPKTQGYKTSKLKFSKEKKSDKTREGNVENFLKELKLKTEPREISSKGKEETPFFPTHEQAKDQKSSLGLPNEEGKQEDLNLGLLSKTQGKKVDNSNHLSLEKALNQGKISDHIALREYHSHHQVQQQANMTPPETKLIESSTPQHPRPLISLEPAQIPDFVKELVLKPNRLGRNEARIRLEPPHLGELHVTLSVDKGEVRLLFTVEHPQAAQALHQELHQLAKSLAEVGLQLGGCQIDLSGGKHQPFQEHLYPDFKPMAPERDLSLVPAEAPINHRSRGLIDVRV